MPFSLEEARGEQTPQKALDPFASKIRFDTKAPKGDNTFTLEEARGQAAPSKVTEGDLQLASERADATPQTASRFLKESGLGALGKAVVAATNPIGQAGLPFSDAGAELGRIVKGGMIGNLRSAAQEGKFSDEARKQFGPLVQFGKDVASSPSEAIGKLTAGAKQDPVGFTASLIRGFMADPELLLAPGGMGGSVARAGGRVAGRAGAAVGRAAEGGAVGGGMMTAIEAARQLQEMGFISPEGLTGPAEIGVMFGATPAALFGRTHAQPKIRITDPKQMFADDASHAQFEADFRQPAGTDLVSRQPRARPKGTSEIVEPGTPEWYASDVAKAAALGAGAIGLGYAMGDEEGAEGAGLAMAAGGIKPRGGNWHPEASRRLADAMTGPEQATIRTLQGKADTYPSLIEFDKKLAEAKVLPEWSHQAVSRYLNRYAGTAEDPLKDVKLPNGDTWEEATDKVFKQKPAREYNTVRMNEQGGWDPNSPKSPPDWLKGTPPDEPIWSFEEMPRGWGGENQYTGRELTSYLSHVGDFLRQNVDPKDLPRYDLVRAVKETAKNDERVAKEMEKSRGGSAAQLPVYKDYPGSGMKWVEIKEPAELTAEQAKGVKQLSPEEISRIEEEGADFEGRPVYTALDAKGKPMIGSYTGSPAVGNTPQQAWLAGRLAEEGNTMGHCVGGYCEGVASGESKIFSLRDGKGESHVTVEVAPPDVRTPTNSPAHFARVIGGETLEKYNKTANVKGETIANRDIINSPEYQQWIKNKSEDILQIKGKQNRAPADKYKPYVQDFVKGGKWGEVGDLEHTGLERINEKYRDLEPGFYTQAEIDAAQFRNMPVVEFTDFMKTAHPSVSLDLREGKSGAITLADIALKPSREGAGSMIGEGGESIKGYSPGELPTGRGWGQAAIRELTSYADANGRGIMLVAAQQDPKGPPTPKLVEIYKRHGFKEAAYQPFPSDIAVRMYRNAEGVKDADLWGPEDAGVGKVEEANAGGAGPGDGGGLGEGGVPPQEAPRRGRGQEGSVDKRLLAGLAGAGIGVALAGQLLDDPSNRQYFVAALAGGVLPYVGRIAKTLTEGGDALGGMLSTRLKHESEPLHFAAQMYEREKLRDSTKYATAAAPFFRAYQKLKDPEFRRVITDNEPAATRAALLRTGNPEITQGWNNARAAIREIGDRLVAAGKIDHVLDGYFPRVVKDTEGLFKYIEQTFGVAHLTELQKRMAEAQRKAAPAGGLDEIGKSKVINDYLRFVAKSGTPGYAKGRTVPGITKGMLPFYHDLPDAYEHYVNAAVDDLAKAKFFGRDGVLDANGQLDVDKSAGMILNKEQQAGRITNEQYEKVRDLINSHLGPTKRLLPDGTRRTVQDIQNLTYASLLGDIVSAATQAGDPFIAVYANGLIPSMRALGRRLTGNMKVDLQGMGLVNHISDEFSSRSATAKYVNFSFKAGFSLLDRLGKAILGESSYIKYAGMTDTPAGTAKLAKEYGQAFGDKFPELVDDLQARRSTDLTQSLAWLEIARRHPISRLEAPEWYNAIPDLRPVAMLKRYMLKQYDVLRRDAYDEIKKGDPKSIATGMGRLMKYATVMAIAQVPVNMVQNWLQNKPMDEDIWMPRLDNVLKTFGWSEYTKELLDKKGLGSAVANFLAPPFGIIDKVMNLDLRVIPWIGKMLYGQIHGDEIAKKDEAKKRKKEREESR